MPAGYSGSAFVQQLNQKQLQLLNSLSIAEAARYFSGLLVKDYGGLGGLKTVSVRSLGTGFTGVLFDKIMMTDVQGGQVDIGRLSVANIREIKLYIPQPDDLLQTARAFSTGSVLSLNTGYPGFAKSEKLHYQAAVRTGSFAFFNPLLNLHWAITPRLVSSLNIEHQQTNGRYRYTLFNGDSTRQFERKNSDLQSWRIEWNNYLRFADSSTLQTKVYYYTSKRGIPGYVILYNDATGKQRLKDDQLIVQSYWEKHAYKNSWLVSGRYQHNFTKYADTPYLNNAGKLESVYRQSEAYLSGTFRRNLSSSLQVSAAADYSYTTLKGFVQNNLDAERHTVFTNIAVLFHRKRFELSSNGLMTYAKDLTLTGGTAKERKKFTPAVSFSYQPFNALPLRVRAFLKSVYRMPSFNELYYTYVGNTNLRPEYAQQYNAGLTWQQTGKGWVQAWAVSADAYYNRVKDKIVAAPRQNLFNWSMLNTGQAEIKGLDATAQAWFRVTVKTSFSLRSTYSFQQALDMSDPGSSLYRNQLAYTPRHSGSVNAFMHISQLDIGYNVLWTGNRYTIGENIPENKVKAFQTHDISIIYNIKIKYSRMISLTAEVINLYNKQYAIIQYYPMPGRYFRAGLILKK